MPSRVVLLLTATRVSQINMDDREWMYRRMRSGRVIEELPPFPRRSGLEMLAEVSKFTEGHKKVTNKVQVEGSICEAYLIDKITNFTSYYFGDDVQTIWNRVPRNDDGGAKIEASWKVIEGEGEKWQTKRGTLQKKKDISVEGQMRPRTAYVDG
ncbi:hypothetical protein SADUNF_Sadunf16G0088200 [Salix dunnii]|uniref:DUF4218 domain-containing protein n=1 Tax=Salix dunnii TaxID=1413687 RepID=A0A835J966_9ROSI|nr:hypothetical protein SADUNF_Sadunf16G0088200 [Salix dunnii]